MGARSVQLPSKTIRKADRYRAAYFGNVISILTTQAQILFIAVCVYTFVSYGTAIGFQFGYCGPVSNNWYVHTFFLSVTKNHEAIAEYFLGH